MFIIIILKMRQLKQKNHAMFCAECDKNRMYNVYIKLIINKCDLLTFKNKGIEFLPQTQIF